MMFLIQKPIAAISERRRLGAQRLALFGQGSGRRLGLKLLLCLIALIVIGGSFVASVLSRPVRTPILTLAGVYGPEWDLNSWVAEDLDAIGTLSQGTFSVGELPSIDQMAGGFWDQTDERIRAALAACPSDRPLTFYVNLHGAVDDDGRACWIPPNGLVADATTWFPIQDFLDHVAQLQTRDEFRPVVLLLECGRLRAHWPAGISENQFDDRLTEALASHSRSYPQSNVTILSSVSRGQRSLFSRLGDGDVFTRFVVDGLFGAADGCEPKKKADGYVDIDELHRYVRQQVGGWAQQHRGVDQTPTLHRVGSSQPFVIDRVTRRHRKASHPTPAPSKDDLQRLRTAVESVVAMRDMRPIAVDAHAWSQIQRTLHSIAQSVYGGNAVRQSSDRWYSRLERQLQSLRQEIAMRASESSHWADIEMNRSAHRIWSTIAKQPTRSTAEDMVDGVDHDKTMPVPMLYALLANGRERENRSDDKEQNLNGLGKNERSQKEFDFWRDPDLIRRVAVAQAGWLETTLGLPDGLFPAADQISTLVHDHRRRLADTILASGSPGDQTFEEVLSEFESSAKTASAALSELTLAWEIRAQSFLELPYLIQVINEVTVPSHSEHSQQDDLASIDDVMRLDTLLNQFIDQQQPWTSTLRDQIAIASKRSRDFLQHLSGARESTLMSMSGSSVQGSSLSMGAMAGTMSSANRCRLIASDPSQEMRVEEQLRQLDRELSRQPVKPLLVTSDPVGQTSEPVSDGFLAVLLGLDPDTTGDAQVRKQLRDLASLAGLDAGARHESRRVVSIIVNEHFSSVISANQKAQRQSRLASRINEVLDDFWFAPSSDGTAYFDQTSQALLTLADSETIETSDWKTARRSVNDKLIARRLASKNGLVIRASSTPSFVTLKQQSVSVSLDRSAGQGELPSGTAALSIRPSGAGSSLTNRPIAIRESGLVPAPRQTQTVASTNELTLTTQRTDHSVAEINFRGNRYQSSVMSSGTAFGVTTNGQPNTTGAEITIRDAMDAGRAVSFVLDCSASMNDPLKAELGIASQSTTAANKFDAARSALYEMMRRMQPSAAQVGLVMYGHRMAISGDERFAENNGLVLQKRYHQRFPFSPSIQPFEDVEIALATGRFDTVELELARQHLDAAVPWGQTPLYLAISKAIDDVSRSGDGVTKDIIVVSDGRNYQFNPTADTVFTLDQLIVQANEQDVRVHVIGFGVPTAEAATAAFEFETLASGTGGESVNDVKDATELLRRMEQLSSSESFKIKLPDGTERSGRFSETLRLPTVKDINTPVSVTISGVSTEIVISPGDRLELVANQMQHLLRSPPYLAGAPVFRPFATAEDHSASVRIGVDTPLLNQNDCRFRISLQRGDQQVSDRPKAMWVEIVPVDGETSVDAGSDQRVAYRTSQFEWLAKRPCPVAQFVCLGWPSDATGYQLNAWCVAESPASDPITLDTVSTEGQMRRLAGFDGVTYQVYRSADAIQIGFEYAKSDSVDLDAMMVVNLKDGDIASADHWYDDGGKHSFHVFRFAAAADAAKFELETIADLKKRSVHTVDPVQGSMVPNVATLSATTTSGVR
ncbi:hypothetical protein K227x_23430 [Rubripirellula lacrimiformis]|uniref:VWFA domain-containing protein n=1 Tax=Rubripirellula lacrimiformis TaxID=1930273 RepID=A0A517N9Z6_9BACT|nr:vWA domain-containing protein [Rubripirellula lacrimiformis]QDT03957.1 hypothetical protein K227x_23430 [Rubripirellula lacrimiformis]